MGRQNGQRDTHANRRTHTFSDRQIHREEAFPLAEEAVGNPSSLNNCGVKCIIVDDFLEISHNFRKQTLRPPISSSYP